MEDFFLSLRFTYIIIDKWTQAVNKHWLCDTRHIQKSKEASIILTKAPKPSSSIVDRFRHVSPMSLVVNKPYHCYQTRSGSWCSKFSPFTHQPRVYHKLQLSPSKV